MTTPTEVGGEAGQVSWGSDLPAVLLLTRVRTGCVDRQGGCVFRPPMESRRIDRGHYATTSTQTDVDACQKCVFHGRAPCDGWGDFYTLLYQFGLDCQCVLGCIM